MGNSNCISCINYTVGKLQEDGSNHLEIATKPQISTYILTDYDFQAVISIQTYWRGYIQKKHYQFLKKLTSCNSFFPRMDLFETVGDIPLADGKVYKEYEYLSGVVYKGEWLGGFRHGYGVANWPDGSKYEGEWSFGYAFGKGTFSHSDGESFTGNWINPYSTYKEFQDRKNGYVWLSSQTHPSPRKSLSHLKKVDLLTISIKSVYSKLEALQIEFSNISLTDEVFEKSGIMFQGTLISGEKEGFGISVWGNGDKFTGFWKKNQKHGLGKEEWVDGSSFFGQFVKGSKEGLGKYAWEDGTSYTGGWMNNKYEGIGVHTWIDGKQYKGHWKNGLMHGFGVLTWPNGQVYEGEWAFGKKHGVGLSKYPDGTSNKDLWEFGKIKKFD